MNFHSLEPLPPTNFRITETLEGISDIEVYFEWDNPLGNGPEFIVENYTLQINSSRGLHTVREVYSTISSFTLEYNMQYRVGIMSVNCVGESTPSFIESVNFGEKSVIYYYSA